MLQISGAILAVCFLDSPYRMHATARIPTRGDKHIQISAGSIDAAYLPNFRRSVEPSMWVGVISSNPSRDLPHIAKVCMEVDVKQEPLPLDSPMRIEQTVSQVPKGPTSETRAPLSQRRE